MKTKHEAGSHEPGSKVKFASGAVRCSDADTTRYDLVTPVGLRRVAEAYAEGAIKYDDNNWLKGIPASNLMNHAIRHLMMWLSGDKTEDHLGHAAWNLFALMHFEETRPELIDVYGRSKPFVKAEPVAEATEQEAPSYEGGDRPTESDDWQSRVKVICEEGLARTILKNFAETEDSRKTIRIIVEHFPKLAGEYGYSMSA